MAFYSKDTCSLYLDMDKNKSQYGFNLCFKFRVGNLEWLNVLKHVFYLKWNETKISF